jgi:uncharacterized protein involved in exopolysaccharide biosynthesis
LRPSQWVRLAVLALVFLALGAAAGWGAAQVLPKTYQAHAEILYALSREQPTGFLREDRNITTQIVLLDSRSVLQPVAEQWGVTVASLAAALDAEVLESSEVITVTLNGTDPDLARRMLDSIVDSYLDVSNNDPRSELRDYLDAQLTEVTDRIAAARAVGPDGGGELAALVEREQWLRTQLDELQFSDIAGPGASVLVPPYADDDPATPRLVITVAAGTLVAAIVAMLAVALLARRMTRP